MLEDKKFLSIYDEVHLHDKDSPVPTIWESQKERLAFQLSQPSLTLAIAI